MANESENRPRGRPRGPEKVKFLARIRPEDYLFLKFLSETLEGGPTINGLIQTALTQYLEPKRDEQRVQEEYAAWSRQGMRLLK